MNTVFVMKNEGISKSFNKEYVEFLNYFVHSIENGNILNFLKKYKQFAEQSFWAFSLKLKTVLTVI